MTNPIYDFPIKIEELFTVDGREVEQARAVRRTDTDKILSVVSDKYGLIEHRDVFEQVNDFIKHFGAPTIEHYVRKDGAEVAGVYTFKQPEYLKEVKVGDTVGLRVYARNSYNTKSSLNIQIGSLVLSCLNGMVSAKDDFFFNCRHTKNIKLDMPKPEEIVQSYAKESKKWKYYSESSISRGDIDVFLATKPVVKSFPTGMIDYMGQNGDPNTVWDLMQNATNFVTHQSPKMSEIGKYERLEKVSRVFNSYF